MSLQNRLNCSFTVEVNKQNEQILKDCFHDDSEDEEEADIVEAFRKFDQDGDGFLSARELRQMMRRLGVDLTVLELQDCLRLADLDKDGKLSYSGKNRPLKAYFRRELPPVAVVRETTLF